MMTNKTFSLFFVAATLLILIGIHETLADENASIDVGKTKDELSRVYTKYLDQANLAFEKNIYEIKNRKIEGRQTSDCVLHSVRDVYRARQKVLSEYLTCFTDTLDKLGRDPQKEIKEIETTEILVKDLDECCQKNHKIFDNSVTDTRDSLNKCTSKQ